MGDPRHGTYTFLFTDIEGSTNLLRALGDAYVDVLARHDAIIHAAAQAHGGRAFGSEGDAQNLVFDDPLAAIRAAAEAQRGLATAGWPEGYAVRVRMGIHTGPAQQAGGDFVGMSLHETARIAAAGHGGQVLVSAAAFELTRDALPEDLALSDLGVHGLKDFDRPAHLYQLDINGLRRDFPALRARSADNTKLPGQITTFVDRAEVEVVAELVRRQRLVTLTGPGGTGKTRLSIAVATEIGDAFPDGVVFVALDGVADAGLVSSEIATALGIAAGSGPPIDAVTEYLDQRRMLLLIDNVEHVIDAGVDIAEIVRACQDVHVLATSRIPLQVYGEQEFPVPALAVPPAGADLDADMILHFEAANLFVERARAARPDFTPSDGDAILIAGIVARLDGLPLAIELAAARLRMLPLAALRERVEDSLAVLRGGGRDRPTRQQTLRGAIAWSHDLLDEADQRLFARFGVISGTSTLALAENICGPADDLGRDVFEGIESLAAQSLLRLIDNDTDGEPRYGMLATIRQFAVERLEASGEAAKLHRRHAEALLALAEEAAASHDGSQGVAWKDRLETDHDDLRAAIDWATANGEAEIALRLIVALWRFWQVRGHLLEGQERAELVLAMPEAETVSPALHSRAEGAAGGIAYWRMDQGTHGHYQQALKFAREADDRALLAESLYNFGFTPTPTYSPEIRVYVEGRPYYEEALSIYRELGDRAGESSSLWTMHQTALAEHDMQAAIDLGEEALDIARELDDPFRIGWSAYTLGLAYSVLRDWPTALERYSESFEVFVQAADAAGSTMIARAIGLGAVMVGLVVPGWRLIGATARMATEAGADLAVANAAVEGFDFRDTPETDVERRAYAEGRGLSDAEAIELARAVVASAGQALEAMASGES